MSFALAAVIGLSAFALFAWLSRQSTMFVLSVRDGRVLVVRGGVPTGFLSEARDVIGRARIRSGTIRAQKTENACRLTFSGAIDEGTQQRLRNVFGRFPAAQLRHAPRIKNPTLGQILGVAWLAWMLDRSFRD